LENQNLNDPSKDNVTNNDSNHPVIDDQQEPMLDEHRFKEETSAEIVDEQESEPVQQDPDRHEEVSNAYGWIAIALSAISFFLIPILFAAAGIILGFIARNREAPVLGNTAIVLGILSIIVRLFILPLI